MNECDRMINVFGYRETELAAIRILDAQWDRPFDKVDPSIFKDDMAREGFEELQANGWIVNGVPTRAFWRRVHER